MAGPFTIVLADAHVRFRQEIKKILEEHPGVVVSGEAGNSFELFEVLRQSPPALVIIDVSMPDLRTREAIRLIKLHYPEVKVLIMIMNQEPEYFSYGLASGAEGVLQKQYLAAEIFLAIASIRKGKIYIPPAFLDGFRHSDYQTGFTIR
jgi:DNA-binding NarL/FixJ family response regulator